MDHYFSSNPSTKYTDQLIDYRLGAKILKFFTSSSVFSKKKVDLGSDLLIRESIINENSKVLDLGCGYGVVGISIKSVHPSINLVMLDINHRALDLSRKNVILNGISARIVYSDSFAALPELFDTVLLNPPNSAGKKVCFQLIDDVYQHLVPNGTLQLVSMIKKGGKELKKHMEKVFGNVDTIGRQSGYHLFLSRKLGSKVVHGNENPSLKALL